MSIFDNVKISMTTPMSQPMRKVQRIRLKRMPVFPLNSLQEAMSVAADGWIANFQPLIQ